MADDPGVVVRATASPGFAVAGVVADVSAVILLVANEQVRNWVSANPLILIAVTGACILGLLLTINAYSRARARYATSVRHLETGQATEIKSIRAENSTSVAALQQEKAQLQLRVGELEQALARPDEADIARWQEFWADIGRDSRLYRWFKEEFYTTYAWDSDFRLLDTLAEKWKRDPIGYYDRDLNAAFDVVRDRLYAWRTAMTANYWVDREYLSETGTRRLAFPPEWDYEKKDSAVEQINDSWDALNEGYEAFVSLAKKKHLVGAEAVQ